MTHDIDCHVLTLPNTRMTWCDDCLDSLSGQPVNIHVVAGIPGDYKASRAKGFTKGSAPFVSFVDSDDWAIAGAFSACLDALRDTRLSMVWTCSYVADTAGRVTRSLNARRPHQLIVARREAVAAVLQDGPMDDEALWNRVGPWGAVQKLPLFGYVWREHDGGHHRRKDAGILADCKRTGEKKPARSGPGESQLRDVRRP